MQEVLNECSLMLKLNPWLASKTAPNQCQCRRSEVTAALASGYPEVQEGTVVEGASARPMFLRLQLQHGATLTTLPTHPPTLGENGY